jgi:hypothetical protein
MKLSEMDWNKLAGVKPESHQTGTVSFTIGFHPEATKEDIAGEIEDLQMKIREIIEDAIEDRTTLITGIHFTSR